MRKIDIERSRDYYKEIYHSAMRLNTEMARAFEVTEQGYRKRIDELENKLEVKAR